MAQVQHTCPILWHNEIHGIPQKTSQSVTFFMHCITVTILLRIIGLGDTLWCLSQIIMNLIMSLYWTTLNHWEVVVKTNMYCGTQWNRLKSLYWETKFKIFLWKTTKWYVLFTNFSVQHVHCSCVEVHSLEIILLSINFDTVVSLCFIASRMSDEC